MRRYFSAQGVLIAILAILFVASLLHPPGAKSAAPRPDTRIRHNESHITIHQDAREHYPIIGWAVENGTPGENTFHDTVRFLTWSALNPGEHRSRCVITISKIVSDQPDESPMEDDPGMLISGDLDDPKPSLEQAYIIPCSERAKSTRVVWPHDSIVLIGHVAQSDSENSENDNASNVGWHFVIDEVSQAPTITQLDDPGRSLEWVTPAPSPSSWEVVRRSKVDGRRCFSALHSGNYGVAASSCERAAADFTYAANHLSARGTASNVATLAIISSLYRKCESLALYKLGRDSDSREAFYDGRALLHVIYVTAGCVWCQNAARQALKKYGEWPPRNYDV